MSKITITEMDIYPQLQSVVTDVEEDVEQQQISSQPTHNIQAKQPSRHQLDVSSSSVQSLTSSGHRRRSSVRGMISSSLKSSVYDTSIVNSLRQSIESKRPQDVAEKEEEDQYTPTFKKTIQSVCINAFGIIGIDVWLIDENDGSFYHATNGYYRHHMYNPTSDANQLSLARLEDNTRKDYIPPERQIPGSGLAGYFWSLCSNHDRTNTWRDIRAITSDPDQPPDRRSNLLQNAGFGKACGIPFDIRGHRGIVIYLARANANLDQLCEQTNEIHLRVSADLIGAVSCHNITMKASINTKRDRNAKTLRRIRAKMLALIAFASSTGSGLHTKYNDNTLEEEHEEKNAKSSFNRRLSSFYASKTYRKSVFPILARSYRRSLLKEVIDETKRRALLLIEKSKGGRLQPPPSMKWLQSIHVFIGAFITILILSVVSLSLKSATDDQYIILIPPFGALMTLQYGLTAAPASQPRPALYGQIISISIALVISTFIPSTSYWRVPLATALAIASMCKLGVIHPPAGAAAAIFASDDRFDGVFFGFMLVGNVIAICIAILINNLNDKKQYPIYYAFVGERWQAKIQALR